MRGSKGAGVAAALLMGIAFGAGAAPASADTCPPSVDRAVMEGAPEPEEGQYCLPQPKAGSAECGRSSRLPASLNLRVGQRAGGVGLGTSVARLCRKWGKPRIILGSGGAGAPRNWIYGRAAPRGADWITYQRANNKMSYIISWCRYHSSISEDPDPRCEDDRMADREAAFASGGPLVDFLEIAPPRTADWVQVHVWRGKVWSIASWRGSDSAAGLRPGRIPQRTCDGYGGACYETRERGDECHRIGGTAQAPLGGILASAVRREPDPGAHIRTVWLSKYEGRCATFTR